MNEDDFGDVSFLDKGKLKKQEEKIESPVPQINQTPITQIESNPITQAEPTTEKKVEEDEAHFNI